ncbi:hypothetical protein SAMN05192576_3561 [Nocardioides szechwanensis]|uniref:Uncharacterized protein n=1 Tax=Nocardioides szechwanensis TaxID=1005944 RepID=A0A1H0HEU5_9ACTN|nr:hypothetical protein [Nocardioides szechwanensis]SDO17726.1 hypothetical protein SAMN05192576_3561 [Nocardioides szechwanensis]
MKITTLRVATLGMAGLVTTGLLALPISAATAGDDQVLKRDDDTPDVVLVDDSDDDDDTGLAGQTNPNTGTGAADDTNDDTNTGARSGRDQSRAKQVKDLTTDGAGAQRVDWSQNKTNDRSRHNTRG